MKTVIMIVALIVTLVGIGGIVPLPRADAQAACTFTPTAEGAKLYHAPLTDPAQEKSALVVGQGYLVQRAHTEHFYITLDGINGGWVDRRSGVLSGDCDAVPVDNTSLADFPTVCTLTSINAIPFYVDSALTQSQNALAAGTYIVTQQTVSAYHVRLDHAFGGWVPVSAGTLNGACDALPPEVRLTARALADARVWNVPDVKNGDVIRTLAEGASVVIVAGPVTGPIRFDTADQGTWYQIAEAGQIGGWVWDARLDFASPPAPPPPSVQSAITAPNARLWTRPDVKHGSIRAYLPAGLRVTILTGPVLGPIRYDTFDLGEWYYVQPEGGYLPGWIWAGRLIWD
jgi:hypothetical protein